MNVRMSARIATSLQVCDRDADARAAQLREAFDHARRHPLLRERYAAACGIHDAPALDKRDLLEALQDFRPGDGEGGLSPGGLYLVRSGGSTRAPLVFPVDIRENHRQREALAAALRQAGMFDARTVALNVFGYADLYRSAAIMDDLLERCDATSLPMSAHARDEDLVATADRFAPTHLLGTPSRLSLLARHLRDNGRTLDIPHLLYAGEFLRTSQLEAMREAFGTRRVWSLYGAAETGIWGWCDVDAHPGVFGVLPGVIVEILDPDADGCGDIAVTNTFRHRFPLFRYRLGDVGRRVWIDGVEHLELRARAARSFQFGELKHDLDDIADFAAGAERHQLWLDNGEDGRERVRLRLVMPAGEVLADDALEQRSLGLRALLQCSVRVADVRVACVAPDALHIDPATSKMPALVDLRR